MLPDLRIWKQILDLNFDLEMKKELYKFTDLHLKHKPSLKCTQLFKKNIFIVVEESVCCNGDHGAKTE